VITGAGRNLYFLLPIKKGTTHMLIAIFVILTFFIGYTVGHTKAIYSMINLPGEEDRP
jgi:hypothetical protein